MQDVNVFVSVKTRQCFCGLYFLNEVSIRACKYAKECKGVCGQESENLINICTCVLVNFQDWRLLVLIMIPNMYRCIMRKKQLQQTQPFSPYIHAHTLREAYFLQYVLMHMVYYQLQLGWQYILIGALCKFQCLWFRCLFYFSQAFFNASGIHNNTRSGLVTVFQSWDNF